MYNLLCIFNDKMAISILYRINLPILRVEVARCKEPRSQVLRI